MGPRADPIQFPNTTLLCAGLNPRLWAIRNKNTIFGSWEKTDMWPSACQTSPTRGYEEWGGGGGSSFLGLGLSGSTQDRYVLYTGLL